MQDVERAIAAVAGAQENMISRRQLLGAGLGRGAIDHRAKAGDLHPVHRAVYQFGYAPPSQRGRAWAALLACGETAVVSHRTAAVVWGIMAPDDGRDPDVTVVARNPRDRPGIAIHRTLELPKWQVRLLSRLPLTSPARTICDLPATEPTNDVEDALQEARVRLRLTDGQLKEVIKLAPTKNGAAFIKRLLDAEDDTGYTRSQAERIMRRLAERAGLPKPLCNQHRHGCLVDFIWPEQRLIVEIDGYATHADRTAFENDRRRDQVLVAAGYRVIRITWRQLIDAPYEVTAHLAVALKVPAAA